MGYSYQTPERDILYPLSYRQSLLHYVALAGMTNSSMGPPRGIDPMTHYTMSTFSNSQLSLDLRSGGQRGVKWEEALQFNL